MIINHIKLGHPVNSSIYISRKQGQNYLLFLIVYKENKKNKKKRKESKKKE